MQAKVLAGRAQIYCSGTSTFLDRLQLRLYTAPSTTALERLFVDAVFGKDHKRRW